MRTTYRIRSPSLQVRVASHARRCAPLNKWSTAPVAKSLFLPSGLWRRDSQRNALTVASGRYDARAERMAALGGNRCGCHALCCSKAELACFAEGRSVVVARRRWADCLRRIAAVAGGGSNWRCRPVTVVRTLEKRTFANLAVRRREESMFPRQCTTPQYSNRVTRHSGSVLSQDALSRNHLRRISSERMRQYVVIAR